MKKISPAALNALKDALASVYWFKSDLRGFLSNAVSDHGLLARVDWNDYKRNIVAGIVDYMARHEQDYQRDLLILMTEVIKVRDYSHLERLDDGKRKAKVARDAVNALAELVEDDLELLEERQKIEERREEAKQERLRQIGVKEKIQELQKRYYEILGLPPQRRGYGLEGLMRDLFEVHDLDPKASFRIEGEQLDGSFTFDGNDFLFEAKWEDARTQRKDLDAFSAKVQRKLDNTLGLFLSINGFSEDGVNAFQGERSLLILMDGADLMAVLEDRIDMTDLLRRKKRRASETGEVYVKVDRLIG